MSTTLPLLLTSATLSAAGYVAVDWAIPRASATFLAAGRRGADLNKPSRPILPESMGLLPALAYALVLVLQLPVLFAPASSSYPNAVPEPTSLPLASLPHALTSYLAALLSVIAMTFLGFADDVLDVRWRHKIALPAFAALPMLVVYAVQGASTDVVVPRFLRGSLLTRLIGLVGDARLAHLGAAYYVYMAAVAVFCTNAINIVAGINGVEAAQTVVIALTLLGNSAAQLLTSSNPTTRATHLLATLLVLPWLAVTLALLRHNRYPARVFVGDTFTYASGMVFAVTGITGHFSKTLLLFFIPQIVNFALSVPQLAGWVPCPRHRLPSVADPSVPDAEVLLVASRVTVAAADLGSMGWATLAMVSALGLADVVHDPHVPISQLNMGATASDAFKKAPLPLSTLPPSPQSPSGDNNKKRSRRSKKTTPADVPSTESTVTTTVAAVSFTNLTLINAVLVRCARWGTLAVNEGRLCAMVAVVQVAGSVLGLLVRYGGTGLVD
ncbi:glycosyl transferase family 4-domain-containing protein [Blastocladiella britannica]|nr:glycosyl transferase family 4-domain-containing protein [Blastocladiella britannica]